MRRARYRKQPADGEKNSFLKMDLRNCKKPGWECKECSRYDGAMHIPTHALAGWCLANIVPLSPRERLFTMVAATAPDIDGLSLLAGIDAYGKWHHTFGHNALFAVVLGGLLTIFSTHRIRAFGVYLIAAHLHFLMDYFGSGPGWGIPYGWPFSDHTWLCRYAWHLSSWQNFVAGVATMAGTILIALWKKRSPFECLAPGVEAHLFRHSRRTTNEGHS